MMMTHSRHTVTGLSLVLGLLATLGFQAPAAGVIVDGVAARVNDRAILISDVLAMIDPRQMARIEGDDEAARAERGRVYDEALRMAVDKEVILESYAIQNKKDQSREIPESYIDQRVETITRDSFNGSQSDLLAQLEKEGLTYAEWRKTLKDQIIVMTLRRMNVEPAVKIQPQAVTDRFEQNKAKYRKPGKVHVRMIVLEKGDADKAGEPQARAEEILNRIRAGGEFAEEAKKFSTDSKAAEGGDWGWIDPGILRPELARQAVALKDGEVGEPIEIEGALYIMKNEGRIDQGDATLEDARPLIERELRMEQSKVAYDAWIARLKGTIHVTTSDLRPF